MKFMCAGDRQGHLARLIRSIRDIFRVGIATFLVLAFAGCAPAKVYGGYQQYIDAIGWTGPDRIAFVYRTYTWSRLYEHDLATGKTSVLIDRFPAYTFDTNGKGILYWSGGKTYEFDLFSRITREVPSELQRGWLLYGNDFIIGIEWGSESNGGATGNQTGVYKLDGTGKASKIGMLPDLKNSKVISPNRDVIATADATGRPPITVVYRLDASGSDIATTTGTPIGWQDDDTLLLSHEDPDSTLQLPGSIYRYHLPSGTASFAAKYPASKAAPSPDRKLVALVGRLQIATMPANGSDVTVRVDALKDLPPGERVLVP